MASILLSERVSGVIADFGACNNFLWQALVCKQWRKSWESRVPKTAIVTTTTTVSQLKEAAENDIPRYKLCSMSSALERVDLIYYSRLLGSPWLDSLARAVTLGNLDLVKFLVSKGCAMTSGTFGAACFSGNMEMIKYLLQKGCAHVRCIEYAASSADALSTVQWLYDKGAPIDADGFASACLTGNVELIRWFKERGCDWDSRVISYSAASGELKAVQFVYKEMRLKLDRDTAMAAAALADVGMLRWLRENGCSWGESTCIQASLSGRLENLQYLRNNGCAWNSSVCAVAAEHGHFEVLKWARENGCEWDANTLRGAVSAGRLDILQWSINEGCPSPKNDVLICALAAGGSHPKILKWLREEKEFLWDVRTLVYGAGAGCFESVQYGLEKGLELSASVIEEAVRRNQFQMVKFLAVTKNCPVGERALALARRVGDNQMLECLA